MNGLRSTCRGSIPSSQIVGAVERFNVDPRDVLIELGKRRVVGGQEDMIIDVANELSQKKNAPE